MSSSSTAPTETQGRPGRRDPQASRRSGPASTTPPASSTSSTRATASCAATASCRAREDVYVSSSQVRRFGLRIGDRVSGAVRAPREQEKYWGLLRVDSRQRRRHRDGSQPSGLQRPHAGPPERADQPRERRQEPEPADDQPGQPDRQGPARAHRQPAEGRQDDAPEGDGQRHHRELPGHPPDGRAHRRAPGGGHGHARGPSRARSSPPPSTSPPRTTPTWPRWRWRSRSARSRPAATW